MPGAVATQAGGQPTVLPQGATARTVLMSTVAALGGSARVYVERHWATDAVGGWGLGLAAAALAALWYERERDAAGR